MRYKPVHAWLNVSQEIHIHVLFHFGAAFSRPTFSFLAFSVSP